MFGHSGNYEQKLAMYVVPYAIQYTLSPQFPSFYFFFFFLENYTKVWTETEEHRLKEHMQLSAERQPFEKKTNKKKQQSVQVNIFPPHVSHTMTRVKNYLFSGKKLNL